GTVSAMLHATLSASGEKTGLFTSPYVTTMAEEIQVGDLYISPEEFIRIVDGLRPHIARAESGPFGAPSSFEILLAVAFIYFKEQGCKWAVLEVGLGGRYDATNVIEGPKATVITNIDYDHTEVLGETLREIARDKAGIIKRGSLFFTSETRPSLLAYFKEACADTGAKFHSIGRKQEYQDRNRLLAGEVSRRLGIADDDIERGLSAAKMPCRFEIMEKTPYVILDGAHNRAKIRNTISNVRGLGYDRLVAIVAIADTKKDNRAILEPILSIAHSIILTSTQGDERRSVHPNALLPLVNRYKKPGTRVETIDDPRAALERARRLSRATDCILVTGSFFLAGCLRKEWFPESRVLTQRKSF
ncbi:MAG: Mur ligase family protein, partial [Candidatus Paceibacterota bacterium]